MTDYAAATRYARALFEASLDGGDPSGPGQDLTTFTRLLEEHDVLSRALLSPGIPPSRKRAVVEAVLARLPDCAPVVRRLLLMLADRDRLALLPAVHDVFHDQLLDHRRIVRAQVTTAEPLEPGRVATITRTLEAATGREVQVETTVDAELVGGMVTRIGGTVFDGSLAHHIARLRQRFMTA